MNKFVRQLIAQWRRLELPVTGAAVVGVSGGADSSALLAAMVELKTRKKHELRLIAAHFNHQLRGDESAADAHFVEMLAASLDIEFIARAGTLSRDGNLEQNARKARYAFLGEAAASADAQIVLTGHTLNDQAETFLINLIRGSGAAGLAAMPPVRSLATDGPDAEILLARPLLRWASRTDTESFCRQCNIDFRHDEMNDDLSLTRVRVRRQVIPLLAELNPQIVASLAATSQLLALRTPTVVAAPPDVELSLEPLKTMQRTELYDLIRFWLIRRRGHLRGIGLKHVEAIENLIKSPKSGRTVELPGRSVVRKQSGRLVYAEIAVEK